MAENEGGERFYHLFLSLFILIYLFAHRDAAFLYLTLEGEKEKKSEHR